MATNPIRKEESKWTPKSIFDINLGDIPIPLESIFSQGSDGVNVDEAKESLETGSSSFFKNFLSNAVNKVAEAFSPNGDKHHIIEEAVNEQIGPTYNAIEEAQKAQKELADQVAESVATQEAILAESQDVLAKAEEAAQSVEGVEDKLEQAQNALLAQGIRFDEEQVRVNRLVQEMIWSQQDITEFINIKAQRTYHWTREKLEFQPESVVPGTSGKSLSSAETPFFKIWVDKRTVFIATTKNWEGQIRVSINWSNGVIDDWAPEVIEGGGAFEFYGGGLAINVRSVAVEVQLEKLIRVSNFVDLKAANYDSHEGYYPSPSIAPYDDHSEMTRFFGTIDGEHILRLKGPALCNYPVFVRHPAGYEETIDGYTPIPAGVYIPVDDERNRQAWYGAGSEKPPLMFRDDYFRGAGGQDAAEYYEDYYVTYIKA